MIKSAGSGVFDPNISTNPEMSELVARTGRQQQRYEAGCRLVAGTIHDAKPNIYKYRYERAILHSNAITDDKDDVVRLGADRPTSILTYKVTDRCIPFKYRSSHENSDGASEKTLQVLMVSSASGPGLVFPKGGWENDETVEEAAVREALEEAGVRGELLDFLGYYNFKSKTLQDEFCPEGLCKAAMFALLVKEELQFWPEQSTRQRNWLTIPEAVHSCRHQWMRDALNDSFLKWHAGQMASNSTKDNKDVVLPD